MSHSQAWSFGNPQHGAMVLVSDAYEWPQEEPVD